MAMDKKKLKLIPIKNLSYETKKRFVKNRTQSKVEYLINAYIHDEILVLDIYKSLDELQYRIFQSKDDFITLETIAWRTSSFENLFNVWPRLPVSIGDDESNKVMQSYLETNENPIEALKQLQSDIRKNELGKKHKKITDKIDEIMDTVPKLPEGFEHWLEETALVESKYIFYTYKNGKSVKGHCTYCHNEVEVEKSKHNSHGICPNCKSLVTLKAKGRGHNITDVAFGNIIQKANGGIVLREFSISKNYQETYEKPKVMIRERNRIFYYTDKPQKYYMWDSFKQTGITRWCEGDNWIVDKGSLYTTNLDEVLKGSDFQYSAIKQYAESNSNMKLKVQNYLHFYQKYPAIEYFVKLGLINLTTDILDERNYGVIKRGKNLQEVTGLSKQSLNRLINVNGGLHKVEALRTSEETRIPVTDDELDKINTLYPARGEVFMAAKYSTIHQVLKYLDNPERTLNLYDDYLYMAKNLNWDMTNSFILFPRHLKAAHDQVMNLTKMKSKVEENQAIKKAYKSLQEVFGWQDKEYFIKAPESAKEIIREGHTLHHCVGSYTKRVAEKETVILFMRKKEDPYNPFFTIEVNPKTFEVRQVHGQSNCAPKGKVEKAIIKYKNQVLMTKRNGIAV